MNIERTSRNSRRISGSIVINRPIEVCAMRDLVYGVLETTYATKEKCLVGSVSGTPATRFLNEHVARTLHLGQLLCVLSPDKEDPCPSTSYLT